MTHKPPPQPPPLPDPDDDNPEAPLRHVYPYAEVNGEGQRHICVGFTCWCNPTRDDKQPLVVVHNRQH